MYGAKVVSVSIEAISWALNLAPVPVDRGGRPSSACRFVLVGLANHAGPDGTGAFPSVATLVRYTGLSERTVRTCLDRLEAKGIITTCDPDIVAARIKRADRRPKGWDLDLSLAREDLDDGEPEYSSHTRRTRSAAPHRSRQDGLSNGVQSLHPAPEAVDNPADEVQSPHPVARTGCNRGINGVQLVQPRGAAVAPEPYEEPSRKPSTATAQACEASSATRAGGGGSVDEFFTALGDAGRLTAPQQARLGPLVEAALSTGWTPAELAVRTGVNTEGVRSPYAVLAARLSPAELLSPSPRSARPPWCGECDERTRMLGFDGDTPRPCPRCKAPMAMNGPR